MYNLAHMFNRTEKDPLSSRLKEIKGFEYPPFSILKNQALKSIHELVLTNCSQKNDLETVKWLVSLTQPQENGKLLFGNRFISFSNNSPLSGRGHTPKQIEDTQALHIYTSAKLEHLLRMQRVQAPEGTDNGLSIMLSDQLSKLSNTYRQYYEVIFPKPYLLSVAHSLAMYALRFKKPDGSGYSQSLAHWLHLPVNVFPNYVDRFEEYEEILKLSLALTEIGYGPQNTYVEFLVRDLKEIYQFKGNADSVRELGEHFKEIPRIKNEIEKAWQKEHDLSRKKAAKANASQNPKRKNRKRG